MKQSADTKQRLLDAAEEVFAREGYRAASLRTITAAAEVNLAAVNYHFGSKRELVEAVFARRLQAMNQARVRGLAAVRREARAAGRPPESRRLVEAFVTATLDYTRSDPGERLFMALVLRSSSDTDHTVQRAFEKFMKPTFEALRAAIAEALPELPAAELWWRLQFTIGAMLRMHHLALATVTGRPPVPAGPAAVELLTDFVNAGLSAPPAFAVHPHAPAQGETS